MLFHYPRFQQSPIVVQLGMAVYHFVFYGPLLAGARLEHQQLTEVDVGLHNLQATTSGSV